MDDKKVQILAKIVSNPRKYSRIAIAIGVAVLMFLAAIAFICGRGVERLSRATSARTGANVSADLDRLSRLVESQRHDFELISKQLDSLSGDLATADRLTKQRVDELAESIHSATESIDSVYADMRRTYDGNSAIFSYVREQYEDLERRLRKADPTE